jgi:serine/threonine protein kinase/Tol biopolymer transport system component
MLQLDPGTELASYRIVSLLGKGGMGEVYLAEDTRLHRKVALKILPAHLATDPDRLRRFTQEARAASALNHPNILTIYDIGEANGLPFIATEYIQGQTLRARLQAGRLEMRDILDISTQIASALGAAHEAGIVHRDIKPENLMLREDGYIKILDFGLAKLTELTHAATDTHGVTMTSPGMVMGTAQYMSPEQARGIPLDARSDIFSLGVVIYEMAANRVPFEGETPSHLIVAILEKAAPPLASLVPDTPPQLEAIVEKALCKDREDRYQTAKDMAVDLRQLRKRLDFDTEMRRVTPATGYPVAPPAAVPAAASPAAASPPAPSPPSVAPAKTMRKRLLRIASTLLIIAVASRNSVLHRLFNGKPSRHEFDKFQISRVTSSGAAASCAISPDGKYIVYSQLENGHTKLWLRQTATGSNVEVPLNFNRFPRYITFSPDGNFLYVVTENLPGSLLRMPVLGGSVTRILDGIFTAVSFSPDARRFAFVRLLNAGENKSAIMLANVDGTGQQQLVEGDPGEFFNSVAWSPDGKTIAAFVSKLGKEFGATVYGYPISGGPRKLLSSQTWSFSAAVAYLSSDGDLVALASDQPSSTQLWHIESKTGKARRITNDLNNYVRMSVAAAADQVLTIQSEDHSNLWIADAGDLDHPRQVTFGGSRGDGRSGTAWGPDGKIVFHSRASGSDDIWLMSADGSNQKQLTMSHSLNLHPEFSGDGTFLTYTSAESGTPQVWRANLDGSGRKQITEQFTADEASISPDGKWVVYEQYGTGSAGLRRSPAAGGSAALISKVNCAWPRYSPDGKWISCADESRPAESPQLAILPADGGEPVKRFDIPYGASDFRWAPDSQTITFLERSNGIDNVWSQALSGGRFRRITNFPAGHIFHHAWSPGGKQLVLARGDTMRDVVLLTGSQAN